MENVKEKLTKLTIERLVKKYSGENPAEKVELDETAVNIIVPEMWKYLCHYLRKHKKKKENFTVNIDNYIILEVDYAEGDGEKSGNFVPVITLGSKLLEMLDIKSKEEKVKEKKTIEIFKYIYDKITKSSGLDIKDKRRAAEISLMMIFVTRLETIVEMALNELKDDSVTEVIISEDEYFSLKITSEEDGSLKPVVIVGPVSKLLIKDDEETELDDDDDDDDDDDNTTLA